MQPVRPSQAGQPPGMQMQMPFQLMGLQNINTLSELSGIPIHALSNPGMQMAAQQLVAQRLVQQQLLSGQLRPVLPAQMLAMQQRLAAGAAAAAAPPAAKKGGGGGRKRGGRGGGGVAAAAAPVYVAPVQPQVPANPYADPGGKVVWAKLGSYPWWPAKLLDPARDLSFPPDADPPRPTSIPIRFFGTYEFQWIGSKRQLTDWEEGLEQFSRECDQADFKSAIGEVERYRAGGRLPDVFYITPEPEKPKAKARGKKRGPRAAAAADGGEPGAGGRPRAAGRAAEPVEDRGPVVQRRKKQRLQELGLLPPDNSMHVGGRVAPNARLLALKPEWEQLYAAEVQEQKQLDAAVAERRAAATAARAAAAADARAVAQAAAAAAAPVATPGGASGAAAAATALGALPAQQQAMMQQAFLQQMMAMQQGRAGVPATLPMVRPPAQ